MITQYCVRFIEDELFRTILAGRRSSGHRSGADPRRGRLSGSAESLPPRSCGVWPTSHGILLIFDEVQSRHGTHRQMWASEHFGVAPDIFTTAKGIASGLPLSAMIARAGVHELGPGRACLHLWRKSRRRGVGAGDHRVFRAGIDRQCRTDRRSHSRPAPAIGPKHFRNVGDVRGLGLMIGFELVRDQTEQRTRAGTARSHRGDGVRARSAGAGRRPQRHPAMPAAGDHARSSRFRCRYTGGMSQGLA